MKAHSPAPKRQDNVWHDLKEHLEAVADRVDSYATLQDDPLKAVCRITALTHDIGKASPEWQVYVQVSHAGHKPSRVPHEDAGAYYLTMKGPEYAPLALMVDSHHKGFALGEQNTCRLLQQDYPQNKGRIDAAIQWAEKTLTIPDFTPHPKWVEMMQDPVRKMLALHMAHSRLVDADCLDTHLFYENDFQPYEADLAKIRATFDQYMASLEVGTDPLTDLRRNLRLDLTAKADLPPGMYSVTLPTGAGKTLTLMSYALAHLEKHRKDRVIVVAPFINIISQNAEVYRQALGSEHVLEHHSTVPDLDKLTANRWDRFCVLTSNVQFFETLFTNRNAQMRKTHRIANSVIILDEVQNLPCDLLNVTLRALQTLVDDWGCTIVFCTATQPAVGPQQLNNSPLKNLVELVDNPAQHFHALRRVDFEYDTTRKTHAEIADYISSQSQILCVLNSIRDAQTITANVKDALHLTSHMTPRHRQSVLCEIKRRLESGDSCRLVSTQVVEAGVDIDFHEVMRVFGPLEAIIQTAGRCNREGKMKGLGRVKIFELEDSTCPPGFYAACVSITRLMYKAHKKDFTDRLHDPAFLTAYYKLLYSLHDTDPKGIYAAVVSESWEGVAEKYQLIEERSVPVIVMPPQGHEDYAGVTDLLQRASQKLTGSLRRALQVHTVSLFESRYTSMQQAGLVTHLQCPLKKAGTFETLHVLDPSGYDPVMGVLV